MPITAVPVYNPLYTQDSIYEFSDRHLPFLEISQEQYKAKFIKFSEITFDSLLHFKGCDLQIGIQFNNCIFKEGLWLTDIVAHGYDALHNPDSQSLIFIDCKFDGLVKFDGKKSNVERSVDFENCEFRAGLDIQGLNVELGSLTIKDCIISEKLDLFDITAKNDLALSGNEINSFVRIEGAKCGMLAITEENLFKSHMHVRYSVFQNGVVFNNGVFKEDLYIKQVSTVKNGITIIGSVFEKSVFINYDRKIKSASGITSYYIDSAKFNNGIFIDGTESIAADYPAIEEIKLNISAELKGNIFFKNLEVGTIYLTGYNTVANITFQGIMINQIWLESFINSAGLIFSDVKGTYNKYYDKTEFKREEENAIHINNSNLGKTQFYQFDFTTFKTISLHNSILTEISTSLVTWFTNGQLDNSIENHVLMTYKKNKKKKDQFTKNHRKVLIQVLKSKQEIYRQLKYALQKQGDNPQSLAFQRYEMSYYRKVISYGANRNWSEYLILNTNRTNDFGQNWLKAVFLAIIFTFIFYVPIGILTSSNLDTKYFADSLDDVILNIKTIFLDNIKNWLITLNPTHRIVELDNNLQDHSPWIYFWDFLSRIVVAYFIYQIINAFRKFNK